MNVKLRRILDREIREASATQRILTEKYKNNEIDKDLYLSRLEVQRAIINTTKRIYKEYSSFSEYEVEVISTSP